MDFVVHFSIINTFLLLPFQRNRNVVIAFFACGVCVCVCALFSYTSSSTIQFIDAQEQELSFALSPNDLGFCTQMKQKKFADNRNDRKSGRCPKSCYSIIRRVFLLFVLTCNFH